MALVGCGKVDLQATILQDLAVREHLVRVLEEADQQVALSGIPA